MTSTLACIGSGATSELGRSMATNCTPDRGATIVAMTDQIIEVRSKTTHWAYQPSNTEALAALNAATDLMKEAKPLPPL